MKAGDIVIWNGNHYNNYAGVIGIVLDYPGKSSIVPYESIIKILLSTGIIEEHFERSWKIINEEMI